MSNMLPNPPRLHVSELGVPERALVLALRALLDPAECRGWVMWEFGRLFRGAEARALALSSLHGFARLLAAHGRRAPRVHDFEDHRVAADERAVLTLCAALQARRDHHAEALLAWLVARPARQAALHYASAAALIMAEHGARIHLRRQIPPAAREPGAAEPLMRVGPVGPHPDIGDQRHG